MGSSLTMDRAGKLIRKLGLPGGCLTAEDLARAAWPQAVGRRIASHTRVVALFGSRLVVEVEDAIWQRQLETLRGQILSKLQEVAGKETVQAVEFRPGIPRRLPQRAGDARAAEDEADHIQDPVLRRLYIASRRRSAG